MRALAVLALASAIASSGCFDVHMVDASALLIDDFDDGDFLPADPAFGAWVCFAFNPQKSTGYSCDHDTGYQSDYALFVQASIDDPPDGVQQNGGAGLATHGNSAQDFSRFRQMMFSAELVSGNPPLPSNAELKVELGCSNTPTTDHQAHSNLAVVQDVDYKTYWQTHTLEMGDFSLPFYFGTQLVGGPASCLGRIDSITFSVNANLPDGQSGTFTLHVDDISFN
jgi:hypothetical protein